MAKHTPGPWNLFSRGTTIAVHVDGACEVVGRPGFDDSDRPISEHEANARLIAASPDLLWACHELAATHGSAHQSNELIERRIEALQEGGDNADIQRDLRALLAARAAIAKAERE